MQNIKHLIVIGRLSAVIGVASLVGCSTSGSISSKPHDDRSDGRVVDDKNITKAVESKLKVEPVYKFDGVDVKTYGGIVQLSGFVNSQDQSQRAEEITRQIGGVTQVVNGLAIKPAPMPSPTGRSSGQLLTPPAGNASTNSAVPPAGSSNTSTNSSAPNN